MPKFMNVSLDTTPHLLNVDCIQEVISFGSFTKVVMKQIGSEANAGNTAVLEIYSAIDEYKMPIDEFIRRMQTPQLLII